MRVVQETRYQVLERTSSILLGLCVFFPALQPHLSPVQNKAQPAGIQDQTEYKVMPSSELAKAISRLLEVAVDRLFWLWH